MQGDVVAIVDTNKEIVVEYLYDAWGRLLKTSGTQAADLGLHNPLRYRGYVYDTESGLYYLQSRYYNPELGRFINADAYASTGQGLLGNNMFAYCLNNAVSYADHPGFTPYKLHDITSDTEAGLYEPVKKGDNWKSRKDKRHGSEKRGKSGARERNVAHPNGEEHSRKPKGNRGLKYNILPTPQVSNPYITAFPAITGGGVAVFVVLAFSCFVMPNARSM